MNQLPDYVLPCPGCGHFILPDDVACVQCGLPVPVTRAIMPQPNLLVDISAVWPESKEINEAIHTGNFVVLQVLPSGTCLSHPIHSGLLLGRNLDHVLPNALDLAELNAEAHGVSRKHCLLQRYNRRLFVTDLESTNGTYLNNLRLPPQEPSPISDGDRLSLGNLHLIVTFA